jgi:2-polyprenyl-3-methyl-5-hydroxy-6-metoxy-1,4-benzoquinol methylase
MNIAEFAIPTHYGDEVCHVSGVRYVLQILRSTLLSRIQKFGIFYTPKFDYKKSESPYVSKVDFDSSHSFAIERTEEKSTVIDFGCSEGFVSKELHKKDCTIYGYDIIQPKKDLDFLKSFTKKDLNKCNFAFSKEEQKANTILLLDIIEHLDDPEKFLDHLRLQTSHFNPQIIITTGNIGFIITRLMLLLGQFNYGKRGILDRTHKRLFTFKSLACALKNSGFTIKETSGIPLPFPLVTQSKILSTPLTWINKLFIKISKGLFSFQVAFVVTPNPTLNDLLEHAKKTPK